MTLRTPAPRFRRGGRPHKVLASLAAHPEGLTFCQLAGLHGCETGRPMLTRYGTALRTLRDEAMPSSPGQYRPGGTIPRRTSTRSPTPAANTSTPSKRQYRNRPNASAPGTRGWKMPRGAIMQENSARPEPGPSGRFDDHPARALKRHGVPVLQHAEASRGRMRNSCVA